MFLNNLVVHTLPPSFQNWGSIWIFPGRSTGSPWRNRNLCHASGHAITGDRAMHEELRAKPGGGLGCEERKIRFYITGIIRLPSLGGSNKANAWWIWGISMNFTSIAHTVWLFILHSLTLTAKALKMDGWKMKSDEIFCRDVPYFQGLFGDIWANYSNPSRGHSKNGGFRRGISQESS